MRAVVAVAALITAQAHGAKEKRAVAVPAAIIAYGDQAALDRVRNVERWLYEGGPVPMWWDVASKSDLPPSNKWAELGGGNSKRVRATVYAARPVVVKEALTEEEPHGRQVHGERRKKGAGLEEPGRRLGTSRKKGADGSVKRAARNERNVQGELLWLEYLRGAPGIPRLHGGFLAANNTRAAMVVQRAGHTLARGKGTRASRTELLSEWKAWCHKNPVEALRAVLVCFRSFAEVGGSFLSDFSPHQFTITGDAVYLVDGPVLLEGPLYDVFRERELPTMYTGPPSSCATDAECPVTSQAHCCCSGESAATRCEKGARGAPEAAGACDGTCLRVSAKTHVFDVAGKNWAFPYVISHIKMPPAKKLALRRLQVWMMRPLVEDRPNFTEAIAALDDIR